MPLAVWRGLIFVNKLFSGRKSMASWCPATWCQEPSALLLGLLPILSGKTLPPPRAPHNSQSFHLFNHYLTKNKTPFLECFEPTIKLLNMLAVSFSFHSPLEPADILKLEETFLTLSCSPKSPFPLTWSCSSTLTSLKALRKQPGSLLLGEEQHCVRARKTCTEIFIAWLLPGREGDLFLNAKEQK